ncbi:MAG: GntR family transcriptional regulator [Chloroflexota bacterium]
MTEKKKRASDVTYEAICASLSSGQVKPGDWLRQEAIAAAYGVSQVTARDALNRLAFEGLAERVPRKGVRIPYISADDLKDIYEMRLVAEGLAWEAAAQVITDEELQQMQALLPYTGTNADPKSVDVARQKNMEFHMIAIHASRRWTLIHILTPLLSFNNLRYLLTATTEEVRVADGQRNIADHAGLLAALEARDSGLTRALIACHIERAMNDRLALQGKV